jgi:ABC-type bacteriocin/lantibiotic exporter with double-glycine peptidase domain
VEFFDRRHAADIVQRVGLNDRIAQILCGELATNAVAMITLIFYVMVMLSYDWALTLIGVALTGVNAVALKAIGRQRADRNMTLQLDRARLMTTVIGGIQAIETIKAGGGEHDFFRRWTGQKAVVSNTEHGLDATANLLAALPLLLSALVTAVILGLGGVRVMTGDFTIGMLVAFLGLMAAFSRPVKNLMGITGKFQEAQAILGGLDDVLRAPLDPRFTGPDPQPDGSVGKPGKAAKLQGYLEIHDASFGYDRLEPPLIEHFSLTLAPGQRVALVGESGSGKSTVAKMVMGLHAPWSGEVLFDGVARERIAPDALNASVAGVDQEIHLFEGTVRDNLTLWDSALPEADMVQAAHDAMIHDTIAARGAGYDSAVGEGGANFSGGQRQRLEIARALATNPRMLVLDEATSALDPVTEKLIDDRLRRRGCTCLVVAHRLSTIRDCDEIIVMKAGKIVERGTHDVLMRMNGAYRSLAGKDVA